MNIKAIWYNNPIKKSKNKTMKLILKTLIEVNYYEDKFIKF